MNIFFISDTHFAHANVILYNNRPVIRKGDIRNSKFVNKRIADKRVAEMDELMIENWNKTVLKKDTVYIVGDFAFKNHAKYIHSLNGKKYLILGSHDKMNKKAYSCFTDVVPSKLVCINKRYFYLNHCCPRVWEKSHLGAVALYGHSHGRLNTFNLSFDVGVDVPENNYTPVSYDEIMRRVAVREQEMRRCNRINKNDKGSIVYYQDDLAYFNNNARIKGKSAY